MIIIALGELRCRGIVDDESHLGMELQGGGGDGGGIATTATGGAATGHAVTVVQGEPANIKLTTPEDFGVVEALIREQEAASR